ncbi:MAG: hypothetical protein WBE86_07730 [Candidatus Acidiferrales bacterium]
MVTDTQLRRLLIELCESLPLTHILETGTYVGLGSTTFIAEIFNKQSCAPQKFITIEASYSNWRKAKHNLQDFPFVEPLWGLSIPRQEALNFIKNDTAIINHYNYPDIFIDEVEDPITFYSAEICGRLGRRMRSPIEELRQFVDRRRFYAGEDLLGHWLSIFRSHTPLVVLDSAGGVGYLEFNTVQKIMLTQPYFLLLDDIHHLKHFRSYRDVHASDKFEVLGESQGAGWLLARYQPSEETQL